MSIFEKYSREVERIAEIYALYEPGLLNDDVDDKKSYLEAVLPLFFSILEDAGIRKNKLDDNIFDVSSTLKLKAAKDTFADALWRLYSQQSQQLREYERVFGPGSYSFFVHRDGLDTIASLVFFNHFEKKLN